MGTNETTGIPLAHDRVWRIRLARHSGVGEGGLWCEATGASTANHIILQQLTVTEQETFEESEQGPQHRSPLPRPENTDPQYRPHCHTPH